MFSLLRVPPEKLKGRIIQDARERVTSLRAQGASPDFEAAQEAMIEGFRLALDLELAETPGPAYPGGPSPAEEARARDLARTKFSTPEWLYKR
jgi:lipoate-protein ligase A